MFLRKYWFPLSVFIVAIVGVCLYIFTIQPLQEPLPKAKAPIGDTSQSAIAQENPTSDTPQDPPAESSRTRTPQEVAEIQREWHDKWNKLSDEHIQTTQEWIDALPQTPEELERFKTDENYKREVQRQLQAAMDKDGKAYVRLQEHEKTRPAIPPTQ